VSCFALMEVIIFCWNHEKMTVGGESPVLGIFKIKSPLDGSPLPLAVSLKTLNVDPESLDSSEFRGLSLLVVELYKECRRIMNKIPTICVEDPSGDNQIEIEFLPPKSILSGYEPSDSQGFEQIPRILLFFFLDTPLHKTDSMFADDQLEWHEYPQIVNINVGQHCANRGLKSSFKLTSSSDKHLLHRQVESKE